MKTLNFDTGYIIFTTPYREYDAMVHFLGEQLGLVRYVLRGYYKSTSKQHTLGLEFSKVHINYMQTNNGMPSVRNGTLIEAFVDKRSNYDWLLHMQLLSELIVKCYDEGSGFDWLKYFETAITSYTEMAKTKAIVTLIKALGIAPVVDRCVMSGVSQVADFSIEAGGFVGSKYRKSNLTLEDLKYIRYIFLTKDYSNVELETYDSNKRILNILVHYIEYHMSVNINSWKLIYDV